VGPPKGPNPERGPDPGAPVAEEDNLIDSALDELREILSKN